MTTARSCLGWILFCFKTARRGEKIRRECLSRFMDFMTVRQMRSRRHTSFMTAKTMMLLTNGCKRTRTRKVHLEHCIRKIRSGGGDIYWDIVGWLIVLSLIMIVTERMDLYVI